jgi:hypothetical protein
LAKTPSDEERAQAAFKKKELQQREGKVAMAEYLALAKAERDKTTKLRALRLANEEAEARKAELSAELKAQAKANAPASKTAAAAKTAKAAKPAKAAAKPAAKSAAKKKRS